MAETLRDVQSGDLQLCTQGGHHACPRVHCNSLGGHSQGVVHAIPLLAQGVPLLGAMPYMHRMG